MEKYIGLGVSDFKQMIKEDIYYVDKTMYIKEIIDNRDNVVLVTRPRRFGKTLNMSMLRYYFDNRVKDSKELFNGLKIMDQEEKYLKEMNKYPVIYLSLAELKVESKEKVLVGLKSLIMELYQEHRYLLDSDKLYEEDKNKIKEILNVKEDEFSLQRSIKDLCIYLERYYDEKPVVLIDEYDVPLQNSYVEGYYEDVISFFRTFYTSILKDNIYLKKAVLTGVSRIAKENLFSGLNNLSVSTVMENRFPDLFGFTENEVKQLLDYFDISENMADVKKWYDGYRVGNVDGIYNPWSILNFAREQELKPYWVNTSSNDLIKLVLQKSTTVKKKIEKLLNDEEVEITANFDTILKDIEKNENNVWGLFISTGYLKVTEKVDVTEGIFKVKIPNLEIRSLFSQIVRSWFIEKTNGIEIREMLNDLITLDFESYSEKFQKVVREMFSYFDVGNDTAENFYHAFVLGMLVNLKDTYYIRSNRESGLGRYDIMLEPSDKNKNAFIMEFKVYNENKENDISETLQNAKNQIEKKAYEIELKSRGYENIKKVVYAFKGKQVELELY